MKNRPSPSPVDKLCASPLHSRPMTQLRAVESDDPLVGGFIVTWPSGANKVVHWRQSAVIHPALDGAKQFAAAMIDRMLNAPGVTNDDRRVALDDIERTNIPSLVASIWKIVRDWNAKRAAALYAANPEHQRLLGHNGYPMRASNDPPPPAQQVDHTDDLARRLH